MATIKTVEITPAIRLAVQNCIKAALLYEKVAGRKLGITGEIGEILACDHKAFRKLRLKLVANSLSTGFDATDRNSKKYQIKAKRGRLEGCIGRFAKHRFDFGIFVFFGPKYEILDLRTAPYKKLKPLIDRAPNRAPRLNQIKAVSKSIL